MGIRLCAFADEAGGLLSEQIEALKKNGINLLEIRNVDGLNIKDISVEKAIQIKSELDKNGIEVWSIGSPIGKVKIEDDFDEHIKDLEHIIELAKIFSCDKIRIFSFFTSEYTQSRSAVIERLQAMVKIVAEHGVQLYLENEKDVYGDTAERVLDVLDSVGGLKSVYDPANYIQCGEMAEDTLKSIFQYADYLHIKDVVAQTGELVPAGYGDGKIEDMINLINCDTVITLEPHLAIFDGYSAIDSSEMKHRFKFSGNAEAFDAAVEALKNILKKCGYIEKKGVWEKP